MEKITSVVKRLDFHRKLTNCRMVLLDSEGGHSIYGGPDLIVE